ncbi:MAG: lamin tail domain-containing protein [Planctomycetales bacterium]|nr:lamin tail domain-containing protein [Planctomycetales bacterium]
MTSRRFWSGSRIKSGKRTRHMHSAGLESLEARTVMAANVMITEIVADNQQGLKDEDGDRNDWIEIYNAGDEPADLNGWHLTDDATDLKKWTFPQISLQPEQFMVIQASGKDRTDPAAPLHTNFQLSKSGEYLGLIKADGTSISAEFAPTFPPLEPDRSYGVQQANVTRAVFDTTAAMSVLIPTAENGAEQLGTSWTLPEFDDSSWTHGAGGVGFEAGTGFETYYGIDVKDAMFGANTSAYIRIPFNLDNPYAAIGLEFRMRYDDGYAAYLNGTRIELRNAPLDLAWNDSATTTHRDTLAVQFEIVDETEYTHLLRPGANVLAIHGLNASVSSDDFLISAELDMAAPATPNTTPELFSKPSPGLPNGTVSYQGLVTPVVVSAERGIYDGPFTVQLSNSTAGASLVYTTDGSIPSLENGTVIAPSAADTTPAGEVQITKTTTLRVAAIKEHYLTSVVNTQTYLILSDIVTQTEQSLLDAGYPATWGRPDADYGIDQNVVGPNDLYDGEFSSQFIDALKAAPSVSISMNMEELFGESGIYTNSTRSGDAWERAASFEFIEADGSGSIQADAGVQIQGDNVRNLANSKKQSFRFQFHDEFGATKLRYPVFGNEPGTVDTFDTIILRGGYNDGWVHTPTTTQFIRDEWARTTLLEMGQPSVHGRWVHVYLNGFYWGVYNMVERANASFTSDYLGDEKEDWDTFNTGALRDGNRDAWNQLTTVSRTISNSDEAASNAAYLELLGLNPDGTDNPSQGALLNIPNYLDYLIVNFYGGNTDWPGRNYYAARRRTDDSEGFYFFAWDTEKILDHGEGSTLTTNRLDVVEGAALPYRYLKTNAEFRLQFADRIHKHFFNNGLLAVNSDAPTWDPLHPENNLPAERYMRLANEIALPLVAEAARWGDTRTTATRTDGRTFTPIDWRAKRDDIIDNYFPRRSEIVLRQFTSAGLYPSVAAPEFNQFGGDLRPGFELEMSAAGTVYYTLDGSDPRQSALRIGETANAVGATAAAYAAPIPLQTGVTVKARALVNGEWSALTEATFELPGVPLRVSELMYHPADPQANEKFKTDDYEFIEFTNISADQAVSLAGMKLTNGVEFTFPDRTVAPGESVVVAALTEAFVERYGNLPQLVGQYGATDAAFRLNNSGEVIQLVDATGHTVQEFTFRDNWRPSTDGPGDSLTIIDLQGERVDWNLPSQWRASYKTGGTPGVAETADFNNDGMITAADVDAVCHAIGTNNPAFDVNRDGNNTEEDVYLLVETQLQTRAGDANLDGVFDSADLVLIFQAGGYEDDLVGNSGWAEGDWDCDGEFTSHDLVVALTRGNYH